MAIVGGFFNQRTIRDTKGTTNNWVGGGANQVTFKGDKGRNTFNVGGVMNDVTVKNLGRDDKVNLHGPGWVEAPDDNAKDGRVRYLNVYTGSVAEVRTDAGRNDAHVRRRVNGAVNLNDMISKNTWGNMGKMNYSSAMAYNLGRAQGYQDGYHQGRQHGGMQVGQWAAAMFLGPLAWSILT